MATQKTNKPGMTHEPIYQFKPSILIVDDEKRIRQVCSRLLTQEGYEVAQAENAEAGLDFIENRHFDIILLDLLMPGLPGMEALPRIRELHPDTVVIVITGYATLDHAVEAMKNGAFEFLSKPFSPEDLRVVITKAIEHIRTLNDISSEKSRMLAMLNQLADGVLATDARKKIALANQSFLQLMNYQGPNPNSMDVAFCVSDETILSMIDKALANAEDGQIENSQELRVQQTGDPQPLILDARCIPFRDRVGRVLGTITVLHDITALKKIDQMKSDFVSLVSHEIRSPLTSIHMQLKVVLDGLAGEVTEKQNEILSRASEKISALITMSGELLDLSKMESGLIHMERTNLDLLPLLKDQVAFYQQRARSKNIQLELLPVEALPEIFASKMNIEEVLANLINNALNYTPDNGKVTVSAVLENDYVKIDVTDTGFGIAPEDMDRIFSRFYRVKNSNTRNIVGTGLGLPIVKNIVNAHHGRIRVESQLNEGSTFSVFLPTATT